MKMENSTVEKYTSIPNYSKIKREKISLFMSYFDGVGGLGDEFHVKPISKVSTWELGLCDLNYLSKEKTLEVTLRRPGLLIGRGGESINKLENYLECKVKPIEKNFNN